MGIVLLLKFKGGELTLSEYTTLDITRHAHDLHINATNENQDLAFNEVFEQILGLLADDETFAITVKRGKSEATFDNMTADYYLSNQAEVIHFTQKQQQENQEQPE